MTNVGYKLFEMNPEGKLFPLFIGKNIETKLGEWIPAEFIPTKGFSQRFGWHLGLVPDSPWLKSYDGTDVGCYKSQRSKKWKRVWCIVEFNDKKCYDDIVEKLPKKCFDEKIDFDGYYSFRETGDRPWIITSDIKVIRIMTEDERQTVLKEQGYDEAKEFAKYKAALEKRFQKAA